MNDYDVSVGRAGFVARVRCLRLLGPAYFFFCGNGQLFNSLSVEKLAHQQLT